jgi:hypothetical protein
MERVDEERRSSFRPEIRILNPRIKLVFGSLRHDILALVFVGTCLTKGVYGTPGPHPAVGGFPDCLYGGLLNREVQ